MNKSLLSTLLASLIMAGFATAQTTEASATPAATADKCCKEDGKQQCPEPKKTCGSKKHDVLTKEERHRFCCAKEAALAANPSLVGKKGPAAKRALCDAILKADPTMKPIMDKLKQHWKETHKGMQPACDMPTKEATPAAPAPEKQ